MRARLKDPAYVHQRRWLTLTVLCVSLLVIVLDNSILNVALPTLARPGSQGGIGASESNLQWIVDAYTLVFAGLLLTAGSLGDKFGRYRCLVFGLVVFGVGSALSASSTSPAQLITLPGADGHRRRVHHARHPVDPHQRLHRSAGTGSGHRCVGGRGRHRCGHRSGHRRVPSPPLLVGIGAAGERPDRHRRPRRRLLPGALVTATPRRRPSIRSARCCRSSAWEACSGRSSKGPLPAGDRRRCSARSPSPRCC